MSELDNLNNIHQSKGELKRWYLNIKEENDKLRTYLGLVKMCNFSAVEKMKLALEKTIQMINCNDNSIDKTNIIKNLNVIQDEINNLEQMHSKLQEGIDCLQNKPTQEPNNSNNNNVQLTNNGHYLLSDGYDVPRKSTGIKRQTNKKQKFKKENLTTDLLNRILSIEEKIANKKPKPTKRKSASKNIELNQSEEQLEEEHAINTIVKIDDRDDLANQTVKSNPKKHYITQEFKTSHHQRVEEAKRRREELEKQMVIEEIKKAKKNKDLRDQIVETKKKTNKTQNSSVKKKKFNKQIDESVNLEIENEAHNLAGTTIQIIGGGKTQILYRADGTFVPNCLAGTSLWNSDSNLSQSQFFINSN